MRTAGDSIIAAGSRDESSGADGSIGLEKEPAAAAATY